MTKVLPKENEKVEATLNNGMTFSGTFVSGYFIVGHFKVKPRDVKTFKVVK